MRISFFVIVVLFIIATSGIAEPGDAAAESVPESSTSEAESVDMPVGERLRAAISADLIDLSALRAAAERPSPEKTMRLTLEEAVHIALDNNPDIVIAAEEPEKAAAERYAATGEFDPVLQQNINYTNSSMSLDQRLRRYAGFSSMDSASTTTDSTLGGKLKTGTQYAVKFNVNFEESTFDSFQGEYGGQLALTLTQPLLRGFGKHVNTIRIRAAENLKGISEAQLELTIMNKIADTVKSYWDLAGATEAVRVQEGALRNAERLLKINEKRREIGTAADLDVLQAKAGVAMRQSELIAAYAHVSDAGDVLKLALNLQDEGLFSKIVVIPVDRPNPESYTGFDTGNLDASIEDGVAAALENRPEMRMTDLEIANAELDAQRARNEMLPQLDIVGSYMRGGRDQRLPSTIEGIANEQDRTYGIGIQGSIIINNRAARGAHQRARINVRQAEERRKKAEMSLMMGVHYAARAVMTNKVLMESNRQTVRLQEANVSAEEKRLQLGTTTSYQVTRVQEDLAAAQVQELQARIAYEKALVDYQLATGTLLAALGIQNRG